MPTNCKLCWVVLCCLLNCSKLFRCPTICLAIRPNLSNCSQWICKEPVLQILRAVQIVRPTKGRDSSYLPVNFLVGQMVLKLLIKLYLISLTKLLQAQTYPRCPNRSCSVFPFPSYKAFECSHKFSCLNRFQ